MLREGGEGAFVAVIGHRLADDDEVWFGKFGERGDAGGFFVLGG